MTNIRNEKYYHDSWWDWTPYNQCFDGTKIRITDVDGLVERKGHFLLIETKRPGVDIPSGQRILFDRLKEQPRWNILVIWGETNCPQTYQLWGYSTIYRGNQSDIIQVLRRWFRHANGES